MAHRHPVMLSRELRDKPAGIKRIGEEFVVYRDQPGPVFGPSAIAGKA
jgi:hypothetical protein